MKGAFIFLCASLAGFGFGFPLRRQLIRWEVFDRPNERSSHVSPTPRGGGIAIMSVVIFGAIQLGLFLGSRTLLGIALLALILAGVSWIDDAKSLRASIRFGWHAAVSLATMWLLNCVVIRVELDENLFWAVPFALGAVGAFFWLTGYTNAFNFMDGINGIAAAQAVITSIGSVVLVGLAVSRWTDVSLFFGWGLAGAAAGFLPHNFPRARMFMGDVSSAPLGFLSAVLTLWFARDYGWWLLLPLVLLHANFILDTTFTLFRRVFRGEKWYEPHREHFYQRLVRAGRSHTFVTSWEMALQLVVFGLMICYLHAGATVRLSLIAAVIILWAGFFAFCEWEFHRSQQAKTSHRQSEV